MVTRHRLRLYVGAIAIVLWCGWPAVASADDCATRAARIAARQVPSNEVDPDCKRAAVLGAAATVTVAGAAAGIAAVSLGLGLASAGAGPAAGGVGAGPLLAGTGSGGGGGGTGAPHGSAGTSTGAGSAGVGPASPGGSTAAVAGRVPASTSGGSPAEGTTHQAGGGVERHRDPPPRPKTRSQPPRAKPVRRPAPVPPPMLRGPAAFAALEHAGLAERVSGQEGIYRLRSDVQALGQTGAQGTGVSGVAYFLRADGTLEPNIAVAMVEAGPSSLGSAEAAAASSVPDTTAQAPVAPSPERVSEASARGTSDASASGTSDASAPSKSEASSTGPRAEASMAPAEAPPVGSGAEAASNLVEEKIRHAVLELFSPGKLVGGRFHDIEHFREKYQEAKAIENPWEAQQAQDYVVYLFIKEIGTSEAAARTLLELPKAKWEPLATLIATVAH
jgi:hypothetical protein